MLQPVLEDIVLPEIDDLITEGDTPADNIPSEKQQRLLIESLYSSWPGPGEGPMLLNLRIFPFALSLSKGERINPTL